MGQTDDTLIFRGLIKSRLKVEIAFYNLIKDLEIFKYRWGINSCLCEVDWWLSEQLCMTMIMFFFFNYFFKENTGFFYFMMYICILVYLYNMYWS